MYMRIALQRGGRMSPWDDRYAERNQACRGDRPDAAGMVNWPDGGASSRTPCSHGVGCRSTGRRQRLAETGARVQEMFLMQGTETRTADELSKIDFANNHQL
jgi:hypothetical protein